MWHANQSSTHISSVESQTRIMIDVMNGDPKLNLPHHLAIVVGIPRICVSICVCSSEQGQKGEEFARPRRTILGTLLKFLFPERVYVVVPTPQKGTEITEARWTVRIARSSELTRSSAQCDGLCEIRDIVIPSVPGSESISEVVKAICTARIVRRSELNCFSAQRDGICEIRDIVISIVQGGESIREVV